MSNVQKKGDKMEEIVFPNQLRMLRRVRGCRMIELAELLGLTISALSKIEKGYRRLNEEQLQKVAKFLDCPYEALFVSSSTSQPEVVKAWQDEQKKRRKNNVGGGLRVLGAGLRYIRGQKKMSLSAVSKGAKLTLSVYHRIEMGQREVDEKTFENIAHALGMDEADLQLKIYELDNSGALDELKNNSGKRGVGLFKGGYNDLPMSRLMIRTGDARETTVSITGVLQSDGIISFHEDALGSVLCPSTLANDPGLYAVRVGEAAQMTFLPPFSVLVVSPTMKLQNMDWVIVKSDSNKALGRIESLNDKNVQVQLFNGNKESLTIDQVERIVWIALI
jgi:transcriptional regulator with XRE-family HTH domain